nr:MAG TPA: ERF superfamily protein [Caudoviricetes sp.]
MEGQKKMNIYQKIQAVSNDIKNIEKNMTVGKGAYAYKAVQDIDVTLEAKRAETKYGLVSIPVRQELVRSDIVKTMKDNGSEGVQYVDIVKMTLRIVNLEDPTEFVEVESFGRGLDPGDKGFGKASTYARKYAILNAYKIATGEDPDADKSKETVAMPQDEKRDKVANYMMGDVQFTQNILSYFNIGSIQDLTEKQVDTVYKNLQKKKLI